MVTDDNKVETPAEQPTETVDPAQAPAATTGPVVEPNDHIADQEASTAIEENQEAVKNIENTTNEVEEAIVKVNDAVILVKDNEENKNPSDVDVHVVVERFRYIAEGLPLDNSFNECFNIAKEDDLPPMGRFANVLATIKRWILTAIKYIKEKLVQLWKWTKGLFKNSKTLVTRIKVNNIQNNKKLQEFIAENGELKNIDVMRKAIIDSIDVNVCPTIKYIGICDNKPKEDLVGLSGYCNSGEFFMEMLPKIEYVLKSAASAVRGTEVGSMLEEVYQLGDTISFYIENKSNSYFGSNNRNAYSEFSSQLKSKAFLPVAFNNDKICFVLTVDNQIEKVPTFDIQEIGVTADKNDLAFDRLSLKDIEKESDMTGKCIAEIEERIKTIEKYTERLDKDYEFIIESLEKMTKESDDKGVVEEIANAIKAFTYIIKPIIQVAPYKWVAFTLNYMYSIDKFYLMLAENIKSLAAASVKSESYAFNQFYDKLRPTKSNVNIEDLSPADFVTNWDSVLKGK